VSPSSAQADDPIVTDMGAFHRNDARYGMPVFAHNLSIVMPAKAGIQ
jgi:hypothetical protein